MTDELSRNIIISELKKNIFVVAGAGSGKTTILVNRMVALIESGVDISKICTITFTVNAAAEFLQRFQEKLRKRSVLKEEDYSKEKTYPGDLGKPTSETRERCLQALKRIDECFLGTIDSFSNMIVSTFPFDAGTSAAAKIIDDDSDTITAIYNDKFMGISHNDYPKLTPKYNNFIKLNGKGASTFTNCLKIVREASLLDIQFKRPNLQTTIEQEFKKIIEPYQTKIRKDIELLLDLENTVPTYPDQVDPDKFKKRFKKFKNKCESFKREWDLSDAKYLGSKLIKLFDGLRFTVKPSTIFTYFESHSNGKYYEPSSSPTNDLIELSNQLQELVYTYTTDFLIDAYKLIEDEMVSNGIMSFSSYLKCFRKMLIEDMGKGMKIIKKIRQKYSYYFLDESQDTNPMQTEIFMLLNSSVPALKKQECKLLPGSLFIVGDPKQSIYRFRGADVEAYTSTKNLFKDTKNIKKIEDIFSEKDICVYLTKNFRSSNDLCAYFNEVFEAKNLEDYVPIPKQDSNKGDTGVFKYNDAINVIKTLVNNPSYQIIRKDEKVKSNIEFKDFMIITKSNSQNDIIQQLIDNNIPFYQEGKFSINKGLIESLYSIYAYIIYGTKPYFLQLMTSPLFGFSYYQAINYFEEKNKSPSSQNISNKDLDSFIKCIDTLSSNKYNYHPINLLLEIINQFQLLSYIDVGKLEYVYFVIEKMQEALSNKEIPSLEDAEKWLRNFINKEVDRCPTLDENYNGVYVANIHKVKGLERPVVILYKANNNNSSAPGIRLDFNNNKSYILGLDPYKPAFGSTSYNIKTCSYSDQIKAEIEATSKEEDRKKYVAATRATNFLFINFIYKKDSSLSSTGYWNYLYLNTIKQFDESQSNPGCNLNKINTTYKYKETLPSFNGDEPYKISLPSKLELKVPKKIEEETIISQSLNDRAPLDAKIKGTIIHRMMELIIISNNGYSKPDLISTILNEFGLQDSIDYKTILEKVFDKVTNGGYMQNNGVNQDIIKEVLSSKEVYCEVPFAYKKEKDLINGVMDLVYCKEGKWHIIDYKTNYEGDMEANSSGLDKKYEEQLKAYTEALKNIKGVQADAHIYHINEQ